MENREDAAQIPSTRRHGIIFQDAERHLTDNNLFITACMDGDLSAVKYLLSVLSAESINSRDEYNWTSLLIATEKGFTDIVRILLKHDVDVQARTPTGENALIIASLHGHLETVMSLLENDRVFVNQRDGYGWTALFSAVFVGQIDIIEALLKHSRIDLSIKSHAGEDFFLMLQEYIQDSSVNSRLLTAALERL